MRSLMNCCMSPYRLDYIFTLMSVSYFESLDSTPLRIVVERSFVTKASLLIVSYERSQQLKRFYMSHFVNPLSPGELLLYTFKSRLPKYEISTPFMFYIVRYTIYVLLWTAACHHTEQTISSSLPIRDVSHFEYACILLPYGIVVERYHTSIYVGLRCWLSLYWV
jgi:hypothetical protein